MAEQPTAKKQPYSPKRRDYYANIQRKRRITNHKCAICGEQAYAKILLTQERRCAKHLVAPLKEELTKQIPKEKQPCQSA